jgi:hypothetical protein
MVGLETIATHSPLVKAARAVAVMVAMAGRERAARVELPELMDALA